MAEPINSEEPMPAEKVRDAMLIAQQIQEVNNTSDALRTAYMNDLTRGTIQAKQDFFESELLGALSSYRAFLQEQLRNFG